MQKLLLLLCVFVLSIPTHAQRNNKKSKKNEVVTPVKPKLKHGLKPYNEVVTKEAVTDKGLFDVHKIDDKYLYEIPFDKLNTDLLWVTRIVQLPANLGGGFVNAGSKVHEQVVHWTRYQHKILLKVKSFANIAAEDKAISNSVRVNNYEPVLYAFDIKAYNKDSTALVVDVTDLYGTDVAGISGLASRMRTQYKVKRLDSKRSFIHSVKSFPENIEVKQDFTFDASAPPSQSNTQTISMQINQSMILLPEVPMQPRLFDPRVGFFTMSQVDYGSAALKADEKTYIRRWRLEPKDPAAYARGELVEPVKPIVYYLDPGTPENLKDYIKKGIEEWQKPFETAGFKNAIIAKDAPSPEEDPEFSPEDIRYSMIRYIASTTRNAVGPSVTDPRSGEIIESDIIWYHNHLRSYRNRYLLETGGANPNARTLDTKPEEIGEMMQMVIAHEVGHALGFPHNMAASYAYPVDSLRDPAFTKEFGLAASIMDYTRYNYVAQPGDGDVRFIRQIGPYDHYVTNWGYRVVPNANSPEAEVSTLNEWILSKKGDPMYKFGRQSSSFDPSSQTECLGDDAVLASTYGVKNLKYVAKNLPAWTSDQTNNYADLEELYGELISVFGRYVGHVVTNIGGVFENIKSPDQDGVIYTHADEATQKKSMAWLQENVFKTPTWLIDKSILQNIDHAGYFDKVRGVQGRFVNSVLSFDRIGRLIDAETVNTNYYSALEMLRDMRTGIWSELYQGKTVDLYRRGLQRVYLDRMEYLLTNSGPSPRGGGGGFESTLTFNVSASDVRPLVRGELKTLRAKLKATRGGNTVTRYHYDDAVARIDQMLDPK